MPEVFIDDRNFELYKQCEIRRPSGTTETSYFYDIVWIKADLVKKGAIIKDKDKLVWMIAEVYGSKRMPNSRWSFDLDNETVFPLDI